MAEHVHRLRRQLSRFDPAEVATVGARVRDACSADTREQAEEIALAITLDVLERRRGLPGALLQEERRRARRRRRHVRAQTVEQWLVRSGFATHRADGALVPTREGAHTAAAIFG